MLAGWTAVILCTLNIARKVVNSLSQSGYQWIFSKGSLYLFALIGVAILFYLIHVIKVRSPKIYLGLMVLASAYLLIIWKLSQFPIERIHLIQYGLVGLLAHRAIQNHTVEPGCTLLSVFVTLNIGLVDELIQGLLPGRVYDTKDVIINTIAGLLGMLTASLIKKGKETSLLTKPLKMPRPR